MRYLVEGCVCVRGVIFSSHHALAPSPCSRLLLFLLGGLLLGGGGLGRLGGLGLARGLRRGQRLLRGLLGQGLLLLGVGGEGGRAARDVDVLAVVRHMLQGKLGAVAGAQTHGAGPKGGRGLAYFWWEERQSWGYEGRRCGGTGGGGGVKRVKSAGKFNGGSSVKKKQ